METRVVVAGVAGRMGATLVRLISQSRHLKLVGATERTNSPLLGQDAGSAAGLPAPLGVGVEDNLARALKGGQGQVAIDFTTPEAAAEHARQCAEAGAALVIGTTGVGVVAKAEIGKLASKVPIVLSPNMSVGVNVMFRIAHEMARILGEGFDVEIVEAHHRLKKDAPSGTAIKLAEEVASAVGMDPTGFKYERHGQVGERPRKEIGLQALRGGDVVGEHTVFFFGEGERLELTHRATSRDQFALGALRAAAWVAGRRPGLYDMHHVLGLKEA